MCVFSFGFTASVARRKGNVFCFHLTAGLNRFLQTNITNVLIAFSTLQMFPCICFKLLFSCLVPVTLCHTDGVPHFLFPRAPQKPHMNNPSGSEVSLAESPLASSYFAFLKHIISLITLFGAKVIKAQA